MFIDPTTAINEGWITHPDCSNIQDWKDRNFLSPNAIDFTLDHLSIVHEDSPFCLDETYKTHRGVHPMVPVTDRRTESDCWVLRSRVFDGMSNMYVNVPEGVVCWLVPRSTMNRNGVFLLSGLYDAGFSGSIGFIIYNMAGQALIGVGTRVGQIIFARSDSAGLYAGGYNTDPGQHWSTNSPNITPESDNMKTILTDHPQLIKRQADYDPEWRRGWWLVLPKSTQMDLAGEDRPVAQFQYACHAHQFAERWGQFVEIIQNGELK